MSVEQFSADHALWPEYLTHLGRVKMARWAVKVDGVPFDDHYYLGVVKDGQVAGHLSLKRQAIRVPTADLQDDQSAAIIDANGQTPWETYVQTFAVDEGYRRRGYGRALQLAALRLTQTLGCYQMRSWSSVDHGPNYALKISLGFAISPAIYETGSGLKVSGVYFVKTV
jgi:GNAT superfamily N-acetyltransferase